MSRTKHQTSSDLASALQLLGLSVLLAFASAGCKARGNASGEQALRTRPAAAETPVLGPDTSGDTREPQQAAPSEVPPGMIYVPGGTAKIGSAQGRPNERPVFTAEVAPFFLDEQPVTVAQFRSFAGQGGYTTEAERFGNAGLFDLERRRWIMVAGADWQHPRGPDAPPAPDDHPVTQVSWNDAAAFCEWTDKRLPTEIEWEHAARGRPPTRRQRYAWGSELVEAGTYQANTWQGSFPSQNTAEDGYLYTAPVGAFSKNTLGLMDMGGNVWEWTQDWYRSYARRASSAHSNQKVLRGGSFMCHASYCHGYRVSARSHSTPETSLFNVGFRCARDTELQ